MDNNKDFLIMDYGVLTNEIVIVKILILCSDRLLVIIPQSITPELIEQLD